MAGQGTGPSRRSHTKSRTGCKTCKRRHIRCDETFPQCCSRNCTKHQVRCDYMENMPAEEEQPPGPERASLPCSAETEQSVNLWLQTGNFPFPELQVFPTPQVQSYSRNDLVLIAHLSSVARSLLVNGMGGVNVWTTKIPQYLSIATSYPYVMHAFLAFSASHLAWVSPASDAREMQIHHGSIAIRGLHDSINSFSKANADPILAASLLLMTQANDWRTYSSLQSGVSSVSSAMEGWKHESVFADILDYLPTVGQKDVPPMPNMQERQAVLGNIITALQRLQPFLAGHETESQWINQLLGYVRTLIASPPPQSAVEEFDQLYRLRKWVYFVPCLLLERPVVDGPAILVLAHLYAIALAVEPLFPFLGPAFCSAISIGALEKIIHMTAPMQVEQQFGQTAVEISSLMQFPQQAATSYRSRTEWERQQMIERSRLRSSPAHASYSDPINMDMNNLAYQPFANLSPGFVPSSLQSRMSTGSHSPFLDVLTAGSSYDGSAYHNGSHVGWSTTPSPAFTPQPYMSHEDVRNYIEVGTPYGGFTGGFVNAPSIWT
ncbi:hypothetical protein AAFC00_003137 [Neodothiora populina]|uniref:Zn(2)-C6 fungal-type domain-containing protein n=1 Tax=Neodothiora populina TaxID=2781224 RepID=A0ABR3PAR5_9PEZI